MISHLERLAAIHLVAVLAEGITEPGAVLARMVEMDNAMLERLACGSRDAERGFQNQDARRFRATVRAISVGVWEEVRG